MIMASSGEGDWTCLSCNNINFAFRSVCNRCQQPKGAPENPEAYNAANPPKPATTGKADWICPLCNNSNYAFRIACNRCRVPRESGGGDPMWTCGYCRNENYPNRTACNRCKQPRSIADEALYIQQPTTPQYSTAAYGYGAAYAAPATTVAAAAAA